MFCVPMGLLYFFAFSLLLRLEQLRSGVGDTALNDAIAARLAEGDVAGVRA